MATDQPIQILGFGLDKRFKAMLQVFFDRRQNSQYVFVEEKADILVADMDAIGVGEAFAAYQKEHISRPAILFSLDESEYKTRGDQVVLRKPFTMKQLVSAFDIMDLRFRVGRQRLYALRASQVEKPKPVAQIGSDTAPKESRKKPKKVAKEAKKTAVKSKEDDSREHFHAAASLSGQGDYIKLNTLLSQAMEQTLDPEPTEYDANDYLQGELINAYREAQQKKKNILIEAGSGSIIIDVENAQVQMKMGGFQLRELASFPLNREQFSISLQPRRQLKLDPDNGRRISSYDSLLWKVSLFAARGRAPLGTDLTEPVRLIAWPNFTRLLLSPGAIRVAALWTAHPMSLLQLCKTLKLSPPDVLGLYSAASAVGLVHQGALLPGGETPVAKPSGVKSLLGSILKKLHT